MIKDYIIQERLGIGAYGIVYKVLKKTNNNIYVIKQVPLFGLSQKQINDVKLEAKILSSVKSIYIVRYYDSFEENNYLNIVMEYCDNGDLSQFIDKKKESKELLKENLIWTIFLKITIGLATLHKSKILHRDLKTLNIFLTKELDIKIGDFGVAKILTQTGFAKTIIGTPYYLSPELCDEQPYNDKSDVWALGCILYELCTYNRPFNATCQASLVLKIIQNTPEPINKCYSENLQKLINIILNKNYLKRPSCYDILNMPFVIEKAKSIGLYEKIKCLYPELSLNNKIIQNNCFNSCANIKHIENTQVGSDKKVLQTEGVGKNYNYSKVFVKKIINLDSLNNKSKSKSKEKIKKKYNIIYVSNKSNDNKKNKGKLENDIKRINFRKIKERIERLQSRSSSKSYDKNIHKNKSKERIKINNLSNNKSINKSKSKSTTKKNRVNKSIETFERNIRKKNKLRKGVLNLHKSKTPLKFNSNYLCLNDDDIFINLNKNDILNNKIVDKVIQEDLSDRNERKKMTNMTDFANFLNNYSTQHKKTDFNNSNTNNNSNRHFNNKKNASKEKIRINSEFNKFKKINYSNKSKSKSKSKSRTKEISKDKSKDKSKEKIRKLYNPTNFSVDIKQNQNPNHSGKIYIDYHNIIKNNKCFNNASINIYNNYNNININNINNINNIEIKKQKSKENIRPYTNNYIIYNHKKHYLNYIFNKNKTNISLHDRSKSNDKKKNNLSNNEEDKKIEKILKYINNDKYFFNKKFKNNNNLNNIHEQMNDMKKVIKKEIYKSIGEVDYKNIMELYEKIRIDQSRAKEYFELIEKYVKSNFNPNKKEIFEKYFHSLITIDCHLNTY